MQSMTIVMILAALVVKADWHTWAY